LGRKIKVGPLVEINQKESPILKEIKPLALTLEEEELEQLKRNGISMVFC
jgi:hypothetical protein